MATDVTCSPVSVHWPWEENLFEQVNTERSELEQLLLQSFDELESWRAELERTQAELTEQRQKLEQEQAALDSARQRLAEERAAFAEASGNAQAHSAETNQELTLAQDKLIEAEQEIESLRDQIAVQATGIEQHHRERDQHKEQYDALELELEHVRNRAGDLADSLTTAKSTWERERICWDQERQELQALLAQQQAQIKDYLARHDSHGAEVADTKGSNAASADVQPAKEDSMVVGSVLAQFERIRNERAIRRRKSSES